MPSIVHRGVWLSLVALAVVVALAGVALLWTGGCRSCFVVEDPAGERMKIYVDPDRRDAIALLREMKKTGRRMWVGGQLERTNGKFGFRFKPSTIVVSEFTAEGLQASRYANIRDDYEYWSSLGTVYILGRVVGCC